MTKHLSQAHSLCLALFVICNRIRLWEAGDAQWPFIWRIPIFFKLDFWKNCQRKQAGCILFLERALECFQSWSWKDQWRPTPYSCLENPRDGGAWWAAVNGVAKSRTRLSDFTFPFHFHALEKEMAAHSSVLAWRIPGTGEPGGLLSMGSHRVGHDWSDLAAAAEAPAQWAGSR